LILILKNIANVVLITYSDIDNALYKDIVITII